MITCSIYFSTQRKIYITTLTLPYIGKGINRLNFSTSVMILIPYSPPLFKGRAGWGKNKSWYDFTILPYPNPSLHREEN